MARTLVKGVLTFFGNDAFGWSMRPWESVPGPKRGEHDEGSEDGAKARRTGRRSENRFAREQGEDDEEQEYGQEDEEQDLGDAGRGRGQLVKPSAPATIDVTRKITAHLSMAMLFAEHFTTRRR